MKLETEVLIRHATGKFVRKKIQIALELVAGRLGAGHSNSGIATMGWKLELY